VLRWWTLASAPLTNSACHQVLVGHSMGGSVAVRSVSTLTKEGFQVRALIILDASEACDQSPFPWVPRSSQYAQEATLTNARSPRQGTAVASFPRTMLALKQRPASFASAADAVQWALDSRLLRSRESAEYAPPPPPPPRKPRLTKVCIEAQLRCPDAAPPHHTTRCECTRRANHPR